MANETEQLVIESIESKRLVLIAGAGISMAPPSEVPSAAMLAESCARIHLDRTSEALTLNPENPLGQLAEDFFRRGDLQTYFCEQLIQWRPFRNRPNEAHLALADFLACQALELVATTNVDTLVETAARELGDVEFSAATDAAAASTNREHSPYVKLHGCAMQPRVTLWCSSQLRSDPWEQRVEGWRTWLPGRLMDRDIVFIGFWTDWDYMLEVLHLCLGDEVPRHVIVVDRDSAEGLEEKAPELWRWSHREGISFIHERITAEEFLSSLRRRLAIQFIRRILALGERASGVEAPTLPGLNTIPHQILYDLRRDLSGVSRAHAVRDRVPDDSQEAVGAFLLRLLARGAVLDGSELVFSSRRIRVLHTPGRSLLSVRQSFADEALHEEKAELVVCVGAWDDGGVPANVVRSEEGSTIIRPSLGGSWVTAADAEQTLGLLSDEID